MSLMLRDVKKQADKGDMDCKRVMRLVELQRKKADGRGLTIEENAELRRAREWMRAVLENEGLKSSEGGKS